MKKLIAILMVMMLIVATAAGCSSSDAGSDTNESTNSDDWREDLDWDDEDNADDRDTDADDDGDDGEETGGTSANSAKPSGDDVYEGDGYAFIAPIEWEVTEISGITMILPPDYPDNSSNINITATDADPFFSTYTEELLVETYESMFDSIETLEFSRVQQNGYDTIRFVYNVSTQGVTMKQTQYMINGDSNCVVVTFTQANDFALESIISAFMNDFWME